MRRSRSALAAAFLAFGAAVARVEPAWAAAPQPRVIPAPGAAIHYRITRTAQGNSGMRTAVSNVTLRRKTATTLTLQGVFGAPGAAALTVGPDSMLALPGDDAEANADSALGDVLRGLNRTTELLAAKTSGARDGWSASIGIPNVRGQTVTVVVPIAVENASAGSFEFHGVGQALVEDHRPAAAQPGFSGVSNGAQILGRHGGLRRGGPAPQPVAAPAAAATAPQAPLTVVLSVDGRVRHGALSDITIVETRSLTVDSQPYVNVSGWNIAAK